MWQSGLPASSDVAGRCLDGGAMVVSGSPKNDVDSSLTDLVLRVFACALKFIGTDGPEGLFVLPADLQHVIDVRSPRNFASPAISMPLTTLSVSHKSSKAYYSACRTSISTVGFTTVPRQDAPSSGVSSLTTASSCVSPHGEGRSRFGVVAQSGNAILTRDTFQLAMTLMAGDTKCLLDT